MPITAQLLLTLGGMLLLGMATDVLGRRTFLPRVSLLVVFGVVIGQDALDLIPAVFTESFDVIANMALLTIGFLLGGRLTRESLSHSGRDSLWLSLSAAVGTTAIVFVGLFAVGVPVDFAILLGCIAAATAPAAVVDVVVESKSSSSFSRMLLMVVALDDAWGLILFSFGLALVSVTLGIDGATSPVLIALREIGGAIGLGILIGLPAAYLTGRIKPGQPMLTEALGLVFVCGGLASWLNVSFLIASMVMGIVVANLAKHHEYPFHAIEGIEWPFMVIFFVLAGASLDLGSLKEIGLIGTAYIFFRAAGKIVGAALGSFFCRDGAFMRRWMGVALLPQAGVAIGMALVASSILPDYRSLLLSVVISATIIFEIIGPIFTRLAVRLSDQRDM